MADELKVKRATAKGQFTISEKRLKDALNNIDSIPLSTLERRYKDLESKWNLVQQIHFTYSSSVSPDTAQEDINTWIEEIAERFDALEIKLIDALKPTKANSVHKKTTS